MNWYEKHLGDWAKKTSHLSILEEGAYSRLCDWCYSHELPLPLAMKDVHRIARASTSRERTAVERVVREFFTLAMDGWHQGRIDKVLASYTERVRRNTNNPMSASERARRYREKRSDLFKKVVAAGFSPAYNTSNAELEALLITPGDDGQTSRSNSRDASHNVTRPETGEPPTNNQPLRDGVTAATSANVTPAAFAAAAHESAAAAGIVDPTLTGKAAKAIKAAGFSALNTADPRFIALVQQGVTDDEWRLTAAEALARAKGWGWLLATIAGRRSDVANGYAVLKPGKGPAARDPERIAGLTPTIASKPPF